MMLPTTPIIFLVELREEPNNEGNHYYFSSTARTGVLNKYVARFAQQLMHDERQGIRVFAS